MESANEGTQNKPFLFLKYQDATAKISPEASRRLLYRFCSPGGLVKPPKLNKLNDKSTWDLRERKTEATIRRLVVNQMVVYLQRLQCVREPYPLPDPERAKQFDASFPFTLTPDQTSAIQEITEDLQQDAPMDRLVIGDVGFGKTEVAMRAMFHVASSGGGVFMMAPTTVLAKQHAANLAVRFRPLGINVELVTRHIQAAKQNTIFDDFRDGKVQIIVGTHKLVNLEQEYYKQLRLLVIDEEQRFGVKHKERFKEMFHLIDVLTLSATPIPRTLQLSLSGVRELSIIETPPINRLAIRTYVTEFDPVVVREALLRETYRGGQSFFVVPRVADIPEIEEFLSNEVPEVTFDVAHGQLSATELDTRMNAFYDGKVNVLVSTSIVESGIDVPTANTIIVYRSDMFGLSQLYQIRGRVGRAKVRAYAYLTTKPGKRLTRVAQKRLRVLGNIDTLGAGFNIASQDMDIRGAGNILGEEQSGNVREVGYELYQSMLEEAVSKIKIGDNVEVINDTHWSPSISLGVPVLIPETYVSDLDVRLGLYKRLSDLKTKVELEGFAAELIDRFGKIPREVSTLFLVVRIKTMGKKASILKFNGGIRGATIEFKNHKFDNPIGLAEFISEQRGLAQIRDNKLIVKRDWKSNADKIKGAFSIARDLASKAVL